MTLPNKKLREIERSGLVQTRRGCMCSGTWQGVVSTWFTGHVRLHQPICFIYAYNSFPVNLPSLKATVSWDVTQSMLFRDNMTPPSSRKKNYRLRKYKKHVPPINEHLSTHLHGVRSQEYSHLQRNEKQPHTSANPLSSVIILHVALCCSSFLPLSHSLQER
jgi:hypothetical protein